MSTPIEMITPAETTFPEKMPINPPIMTILKPTILSGLLAIRPSYDLVVYNSF